MATSSKPRETDKITRDVSRENTPDSPVVQALRQQTANAFVLYANYKHYHWQTFGPLFRDLHKLFDEFAERVRMIGQDPPGHLIESSELATVASAGHHSNMREMVEEGQRNLLIVIAEMRKGAKVAEEHDDPGTVDLFSKSVQIHEKHEWWLRDILRKGDGLCS